MIILPAIDIKDRKCVRLYKGEFDTAEKVAEDPLQTALSFKRSGAEWVHMVDLDGSLAGRRINQSIFLDVAKNSGLRVELGGGIRDMETAEFYLENGVSRVILGTAAVKNPAFVAEAVKTFDDKVAVGIDAKDGMAAAGGWLDVSGIHYIELAKRMEDMGVATIIYTDISKDGTLTGPSFDHYAALRAAVSCQIIASGGITDIEDVKKLAAMNLYGAICGKSIYKGTLDLAEAIETGRTPLC